MGVVRHTGESVIGVEQFVNSRTGETISVVCGCGIDRLHTYDDWVEEYELAYGSSRGSKDPASRGFGA